MTLTDDLPAALALALAGVDLDRFTGVSLSSLTGSDRRRRLSMLFRRGVLEGATGLSTDIWVKKVTFIKTQLITFLYVVIQAYNTGIQTKFQDNYPAQILTKPLNYLARIYSNKKRGKNPKN